ncbi:MULTISPECIES: hypothetical protein [Dyadobacter]|uniref:TIGR02646 family protein n=1 Tax=Dyadobacter pollutisoli TaxID=2910158 RepID=A0A9E8SM58_9BACT|nr:MULTISPECIES: hypothetical protein [Dyadobacter]WAC12959.1 hypothetical protein ON006_03130 [Dyadobacter pollutisoli]
MIKLRKPSASPIVPNALGHCKLIEETAENNSKFDANKDDYFLGTAKFTFDSKIYGHDNIKTILRTCQNGKCAFCEQNVSAVSHGDIEHFRPKGGFRQNKREHLKYPGYYWLAYNWDNMLFACAICNQRYKENLFPLLDSTKRARNHHDDLKNEKPYFINPATENPKFLIQFRQEFAVGIDKKNRGARTIEAIGLNRSGSGYSDLLELRFDHLEIVKTIDKLSKMMASPSCPQNEIDKAADLMKKFKSHKKQFSAMIQDNFM